MEDDNPMTDATMPSEQTPAPAPKPVAKSAAKPTPKSVPAKRLAPAPAAKPKRRKQKRVALPPPKAPKRASGKVKIPKSVVYGLLIALVIASSLALGYFAGKGGLFDNNGGSATDRITVVEYSDYQCPFCKRFFQETEGQLLATYGDKITLEFKNFPLESIHQNALQAAIAAECVRKLEGDEAFWTYHDTLFNKGNADGSGLEIADLKTYARDQGLGGEFDSCLDNKETESIVRADMQEGLDRGVRGTPSFWIKDELVVGALPLASFQQKIDEKLSGKAAAPAPVAPEPQAPAARVDVDPGKNVMGDANAPVEIIEFSDFQCPYCQRFYVQTEGALIEQYVKTGKVRLSYRHFPLSFHQNAQTAAEASECAADQGKFWEMHDQLFELGSGDGTGLDAASVKSYAAALGLDTAKFNTCLDTGAKSALVQKDFADGGAAGVSGTPAFFVNGQLIVGAQPLSSFQAMIDAELANE